MDDDFRGLILGPDPMLQGIFHHRLEDHGRDQGVSGRFLGGEGRPQVVPMDETVDLRIVLKHVKFLLACQELPGGIDGDAAEIPADPLDDFHDFVISLDLGHGVDGLQGIVDKVGTDLGFQRTVFVFQDLYFRILLQPFLFNQLLQQLLDPGGHIIHGFRQSADIVTAGNLDFLGKIALRHPCHGFPKLSQLEGQHTDQHCQHDDAKHKPHAPKLDSVSHDVVDHLPVHGGGADADGDPSAAGAGDHVIVQRQPALPAGLISVP